MDETFHPFFGHGLGLLGEEQRVVEGLKMTIESHPISRETSCSFVV